MAKKNGGARSRPGQVRTGLSRSVLLALEGGEATSIAEILERLGPHSDTINHGTIWTILERARKLGLVTCGMKAEQKRPHRYSLTEGGLRRVAWIKGRFKRQEKPALRAVANPSIESEEEE